MPSFSRIFVLDGRRVASSLAPLFIRLSLESRDRRHRCDGQTRCDLVDAPRIRERTRWEQAARKALDIWRPSSEASVALEIEKGYRDGLKRAAALVEEKGQRELALLVRKLGEIDAGGKPAGRVHTG
jgi:hypothetical protein